jgi:Ser/Thr protein kinase RdoA (MazF antagonist)
VLEPGLARQVAAAFGLGPGAELVGPVATGRLGRIWQLTTTRGRFAVKDSHLPVEPAEVEFDAAYQDTVRASGIPMPAVVRTPGGSPLADVRGPVRAYTWVDLLPPTRQLDPAAVGRLLAAIHAVAVPATEPVDEWYVAPIGAEAWHGMVTALEARGAPFAARLAALVPAMLDVERLLTAPDAVQVCHRDLWADNLLRTTAGELVVLDWENSGPGSPGQELGAALFEFGCGDPERIRTLHAAYVDAGGPGRVTRAGDFTMLVAQTAHIARMGCQRWLAADTDEARTDNADWVAQHLDDPITIEVVDALLRALDR